MGDGVAVETAEAVDLLDDLAVFLDDTAVETVADRSLRVVFHRGIESLDLVLGHAGIEVVGRCRDEILTLGLIDAFGSDGGIEDNLEDSVAVGSPGAFAETVDFGSEEITREAGSELVGRIVVMDAVGKLDLFEILLESLVVGAVAVAGEIGIDTFEHLTDLEVILVVLIPEDVAAPESGFGKIIDQTFLIERKAVEVGHFVAQNLDVGEAVDSVVEVIVLDFTAFVAGGQHNGACCHQCQ